ncbi:MAG: hypothetical protein WC375_00045 [Methanomassiliicoccales archaeon]|jgi:hypothetical protein
MADSHYLDDVLKEKAPFTNPSPQFLNDVESIVQAFKEGGKEKANEAFRKVQQQRKLILWEVVVLSDYAQRKITLLSNKLASAQLS